MSPLSAFSLPGSVPGISTVACGGGGSAPAADFLALLTPATMPVAVAGVAAPISVIEGEVRAHLAAPGKDLPPMPASLPPTKVAATAATAPSVAAPGTPPVTVGEAASAPTIMPAPTVANGEPLLASVAMDGDPILAPVEATAAWRPQVATTAPDPTPPPTPTTLPLDPPPLARRTSPPATTGERVSLEEHDRADPSSTGGDDAPDQGSGAPGTITDAGLPMPALAPAPAAVTVTIAPPPPSPRAPVAVDTRPPTSAPAARVAQPTGTDAVPSRPPIDHIDPVAGSATLAAATPPERPASVASPSGPFAATGQSPVRTPALDQPRRSPAGEIEARAAGMRSAAPSSEGTLPHGPDGVMTTIADAAGTSAHPIVPDVRALPTPGSAAEPVSGPRAARLNPEAVVTAPDSVVGGRTLVAAARVRPVAGGSLLPSSAPDVRAAAAHAAATVPPMAVGTGAVPAAPAAIAPASATQPGTPCSTGEPHPAAATAATIATAVAPTPVLPSAPASAPVGKAAAASSGAATVPPPRDASALAPVRPDAPTPAASAEEPPILKQPRAEPAFRAFAAALFDAARDPVAAPASAPPPAPTFPDTATLDVTQSRWPQAMVDRIERLRDEANLGDTRIRLIPDALGTIDVTLRRESGAVEVAFRAEQPETRQILADARPELIALAEARGIRLADAASAATGGWAGSPATAGQGFAGDRAPRQQSQPPAPEAPRRIPTATDTPADDTRIA